MIKVLSVENTLIWSWGIAVRQLIDQLKGRYKIVRTVRRPHREISRSITGKYPVILLQNVDSVMLINGEDRRKVACRMGGIVISEKAKPDRYNKVLMQVGAVIATNTELYHISKEVNPNTYLIPNGIDLKVFRPNPNPPVERKFTVGFAGNVVGMGGKYKGWDLFVQAVTIDMWNEVAVKKCLHAHSQMPHEKMPEDFYWKIDCLVMPSLGEGCSNVVGEALACGVPVITTKVGFHGEELKDFENVLFIERDREDLVKKVRMLIKDEKLRKNLAVNGRRFAEQYQEIGQIAEKYDFVLQQILKKE